MNRQRLRSVCAASLAAAAPVVVLATCGGEPTGPSAGRPARLAVSVQPVGTTAGAAIAPAVTVLIQDSAGNTVTTSDASVRLRIMENTGTPGAHLRGVVNVYAVAGVARFPTINVDSAGTGYVLAAAAEGLAETATQGFDVAAERTVRLAFVPQPVGPSLGYDFGGGVSLLALDSLGNLDPTFAGTVSITLGANPVHGTLSGQTSRVANGGRVTFTGLRIDRTGDGYTLVAGASGLPSGTSDPFPVTVPITAIAIGAEHYCALTGSGVALCWGDNSQGQLGLGTYGDRVDDPTPVPGTTFRALGAGYEHSCGLAAASGGVVLCWGSNSDGQLGNGSWGYANSPTAVVGVSGFVAISVGAWHSCGLTSGGDAYCWGYNGYGELGVDTGVVRWNSLAPILVSGGLKYTQISAGAYHTCGITTGGAAYCWGLNTYGQLGVDSAVAWSFSDAPIAVSGGVPFTAISAGAFHTCGLAADGSAYCWGDGRSGQLGSGVSGGSSSPAPVLGGLRFASITATTEHTCGLAADGGGYCWGYNGYGELGTGDHINRWSPTAVRGGLAFASIAGEGSDHWDSTTCGVTTGAALFCWGLLEPYGRAPATPFRMGIF